MNKLKHYRRYPRTHEKQNEDCEKTLNLSGIAAVGILTLAFAKGMFWGYMLRKKYK